MWEQIYLDNKLSDWLIVAAIISTAFAIKKWLSNYIASLFFQLINKKWKSVDQTTFIGLIIHPLGWFLTGSITIITLLYLHFPGILQFTYYQFDLQQFVEKIGKSLLIVFFIKCLVGFIDFFALVLKNNALGTEDKKDDQLIVFFKDFLKTIIYIIGILFILKTLFNLNLNTVFTGLSIVGAALALAAKESIENLIASFIIFFDKPFGLMDTVKVNNIVGEVESIGLRSTRIRTTDHTLVTVPNKQMVDSIVDNWNERNGRKIEMKLELDPSTATEKINQLMGQIKNHLSNLTTIRKNYSVYVSDFNKHSLVIAIEYHTLNDLSNELYFAVRQDFNLLVKNEVEKMGLSLSKGGNEITIINNENSNTNSSNQFPV